MGILISIIFGSAAIAQSYGLITILPLSLLAFLLLYLINRL
jgi:hypothetical protein